MTYAKLVTKLKNESKGLFINRSVFEKLYPYWKAF